MVVRENGLSFGTFGAGYLITLTVRQQFLTSTWISEPDKLSHGFMGGMGEWDWYKQR